MVAEHGDIVHEDRVVVADECRLATFEVEVVDGEGGTTLGAFHVELHNGVAGFHKCAGVELAVN